MTKNIVTDEDRAACDRDACNRTSFDDCQAFCSRMCIGAARRQYRQVAE